MYLSISPFSYQDAFDLWKEVVYADSSYEEMEEEEVDLLFKKFDDINGLFYVERRKCKIQGYAFNFRERDIFKIKNHARFAISRLRYEAFESVEIFDEMPEKGDAWET